MPQSTQSRSSHARYFPIYHFFALPVVLIEAIIRIRRFAAMPDQGTLWHAVVAVAIACAVLAARVMPLAVQDRVIRLEETLRMQRLLPAAQQGDIGKIGRRQFVALRFAPDAELPDLVRRVVAGELVSQKDIKNAIRDWRADYFRA